MSGLSPLYKLVQNVIFCIEQIGVDRTVKTLGLEIIKEKSRNNPDGKFVVRSLAKLLNMPLAEIYSGIGRKNERKYAIGLAVYYLHYVYGYDMQQVTYMLQKKEPWILYKYSELIKQLDPKNPNDKKFVIVKTTLDPLIEAHRKNSKNVKNENSRKRGFSKNGTSKAPNKVR